MGAKPSGSSLALSETSSTTVFLRGMRNVRRIHEYFFVDLEIVWTTVRTICQAETADRRFVEAISAWVSY